MGVNVDKMVSPDRVAVRINEGSETPEFWALLGGKRDYETEGSIEHTPLLHPRLFHCSITPPSTQLQVDELHDFTQDVHLKTNNINYKIKGQMQNDH